MNSSQKCMVKLLSCAIRGKKPVNIECEDIDWAYIFDEAKAHSIPALVLPAVEGLDDNMLPANDLLEKWKKHSFLTGYGQTILIENISSVLKAFNESNIPVISLKGLVLRDLYPQPLLRSMSDADILIHLEDFEKAKALLYSMGYVTYVDTNLKEVRFFHEKIKMLIELHWLLIEPGYIKNSEELENRIWETKEQSMLNGVPVLMLSPEDHIIYLCMHMVMHIRRKGFGLRQLCDLVLLIEAKRELIDWVSFYERIKPYGIFKFIVYLFFTCEKLFDLEAPMRDKFHKYYEDEVIDMLIEDIFASGVFGDKTEIRKYITNTVESLGEDPDVFPSKFTIYARSLFPNRKMLSSKYKYVEKTPLLIPVAWIHRIFHNLLKGHSIDVSRIRVPSGTRDVHKKRTRLLKSLELR